MEVARMASATTANRSPEGLRAGAVGLVPVLFQSVANMAPGAAVAFSILFAAPYAGGATPLAVLIGLGLCLLMAVTIAAALTRASARPDGEGGPPPALRQAGPPSTPRDVSLNTPFGR
jgi:amino acid transporter